jgi:hypothetical protein
MSLAKRLLLAKRSELKAGIPLCIAKIKSACEINNIQRCRITCYTDENCLVRSFGEGQQTCFLVGNADCAIHSPTPF